MGTSIYDAVDEIVTVIQNNWTKGRAPNLDKAWERRVVGLIDDRRNQIILTPKSENIIYFGLGGADHFHDVTVDLDIRTYQNEQRHEDVVKETLRIIKTNIKGGSTYVDLRVVASYSRSQYMRNMFNHILTLSFRQTNPT
jgi:hypothetical protein